MAFLRTGFVTLLLVCAAKASQPLESARDQYKAHEDVPQPPQLLSKATDRTVDVRQFFKIEPSNINENSKKPEQSSAKPQVESKNTLKNEKRKRAIDFTGFNFRSNYYSTWNPAVPAVIPVPPLTSFSIFQPQYYQISRPYFIPVWGSPGKLPFYFPPQPVYINAGYPVHNPPNKGSLPPKGYLPPDPNASTPSPPGNTTDMLTENRFAGPVWDKVPNTHRTTPAPVAPTRRTRPPGQAPTTHPPLVHNAGDTQAAVTTTTRPSTIQRPSQNAAPGQAPVDQSVPGRKQPSRCVWAIISCCSTSSEEISYSCFEQLGCTGAFWDNSPCESEFARAAIANVINYYNTK